MTAKVNTALALAAALTTASCANPPLDKSSAEYCRSAVASERYGNHKACVYALCDEGDEEACRAAQTYNGNVGN